MSKKTMILATYNVRVPCDPPPNDWASRKDRVNEIIRANDIQIFGVQEAVKMQLDDMTSDGLFAYVGGGRDDFKDAGEHSCILYRRDRFDLLDGGTFALSEQPDVPGSKSWNTCCPRIASWGKFADRETGRKFCFCNTHLDHVSELARTEGIKLVVAHAAKNAAGLPLILSGDFNAFPDTETYRTAASVLRDSRFISENGHDGPERTFHNYLRNRANGTELENRPIDYIFVSNGIRVLSHRTDDRQFLGGLPSDHFPVIVELEI